MLEKQKKVWNYSLNQINQKLWLCSLCYLMPNCLIPTLLNYCKRKFLKKIHLYVLLLIPPTLVILYKNIIECKNIFCFNKKLWIEPGMFHIINLKLLLLHNNSFFLYPTFLCKKKHCICKKTIKTIVASTTIY